MTERRDSAPYERFLSANRSLAWAVDRVLEGIGEFGALRTRDDFRQAVAAVVKDAPGPPAGLRDALERQLRPGKPEDHLLRCLALACRAAEVASGHSPWHHQIVCALLLKRGVLVEMANGSGKTLAIALAAACSLGASATHIVTSNDYLAERDARWMARLYDLLGLTAGVVFTAQSRHFAHGVLDGAEGVLRVKPNAFPAPPLASAPAGGELTHETTAAYAVDAELTLKRVLQSDVVYGKIEAFAFPYLHDNLAHSAEEQNLTKREALIIDECDTVLLDDLRLPLMVTRPRFGAISATDLFRLHELALSLVRDRDFTVYGKQAKLTYEGLAAVEEAVGREVFVPGSGQFAVGVQNALTAAHAFVRDVDYIVDAHGITLIDQTSGRLLHGRRASNGLHEALEIKEGLVVQDTAAAQVLAKIAIKHFVKTYMTVSGTSGSLGVPEEYRQLYGLDTITVQPYPITRRDHPDLVYQTRGEAIQYGVVGSAIDAARRGQPVLVNVPTLRDVAEVASLLEREQVAFQALDATTIRTLGDEAEKARRAGSPSLITISSKIAARGTDIVLDPAARDHGGLFVIGLEREIDRRYDDQLRGRAGRHGDPGDSLFVLSLEGELMVRFNALAIASMMRRLGLEEGVPIEAGIITRSVARAQRIAERSGHQQRLQIIEIDDILDRHRLVVYRVRQQLLVKSDVRAELDTMIENWIHVQLGRPAGALRGNRLAREFDPAELDRIGNVRNRKTLASILTEVLQRHAARAVDAWTRAGADVRHLMLTTLDEYWWRYLEFEDAAREELSLYSLEDRGALARYSRVMEERFDSFFHDVGEAVLLALLVRARSYQAPTAETRALWTGGLPAVQA